MRYSSVIIAFKFGLTFDTYIAPSNMANNYKYNSQSLEQNEFTDNNGDSYGLDWYNFAARNYDPQLGRWLQPDPLMQHPSPYLAMSNNPISYTDPLGLSNLEVELNPVTIYASKPDWMKFGMDSNMDYAMAMGMAGWDDRPKPITNFEKQNWLTYNNPDEGTFWGRAFNADNYYGATEGRHLGNVDLGNGNIVNVFFSKTKDGVNSNLSVNSGLINAFNGAVIQAASQYQINSITISATTNGVHGSNSRHYAGNALDISMVNGVAVGPNQPIINALQNAFELQAERRENFGPSLMLKSGQPYLNPNLSPSLYQKRLGIMYKHQTHLHWSVD